MTAHRSYSVPGILVFAVFSALFVSMVAGCASPEQEDATLQRNAEYYVRSIIAKSNNASEFSGTLSNADMWGIRKSWVDTDAPVSISRIATGKPHWRAVSGATGGAPVCDVRVSATIRDGRGVRSLPIVVTLDRRGMPLSADLIRE